MFQTCGQLSVCPGHEEKDPDDLVDYETVVERYKEDYLDSPFVEEGEKETDPDLQPAAIKQRWHELGLLNDRKAEQWATCVEWASLGCYCGPARALQMLGLRKKAYPLDFMRSDVYGLLKLFQNGFRNFMEVGGEPFPGVGQDEITYPTTWGGSFWHHDITDPKVRDAMQRRVDRLLGKDPKIPITKPRVFVHAVNGSAGVAHVHELHGLIKKALGPKTPVYLLTIIDNQDHEELDKIFYTKHPSVLFFKAPAYIWTNGSFNGLNSLAECYSHGIAKALLIWTEHHAGEQVFDRLHELGTSLIPFYANDPKCCLFNVIEGQPDLPYYLQGHADDVNQAIRADDEEVEEEPESKCCIS